MALPDSLKKAILQMPGKEKDKLLLRLINKDKNLVDRLHFELIEDGSTLPERREAIRSRIAKVAQMSQHSPGWIMMDMRSLSGDITHHVKITKDKYGEIELNIALLNDFFENHPKQLTNYTSRSDKCALYITKKTQTILKQLAKLDEDYYVDFAESVEKLLQYVHSMCSQHYARQMELPREWN
ncbi:hypothetical protein [Persicitalea jodogahamensis]|uniref:Uncharacterized protein n=1 Tax=Persicitalea jodogahamensis TaxID=402147 RepID=A0A8J3D3L8_9BACT|nr:hypothetical protein [Persicitalea jodogahamensis]GHB69069.1 hypothetical protein GCM10007390_23200 [Persicitalea jodogahamensis]